MISGLQPLTESMFYTLMALYNKDTFGTEIADFVDMITNGRVQLGPGTLYTIISKFVTEDLIVEVAVEGRKRTYRITNKGRSLFRSEVERLKSMIDQADRVIGGFYDE